MIPRSHPGLKSLAQLGVAAFSDLAVVAAPSAARTLLFSAGQATVGSAPFALALGGPRLTITVQPGGATAGGAFVAQPVLTVTDAAGNGITSGEGVVR